jgi:hypothetical protein
VAGVFAFCLPQPQKRKTEPMFEYLEPDANANPEAGSLPLPPLAQTAKGADS